MLVVLGVDPARKGFHQLSAMNAQTHKIIHTQKVKGSQALIAEIENLIPQLHGFYEKPKVILGIEHQDNVLRAVSQKIDLPLYSVNAAKLSYHNKAVNLGGNKSDAIDADAVCHYLAAHYQKLATYQRRSDLDERAYSLSQQLDSIRKLKTQAWQRFWCLTDLAVPDLKSLLGDKASSLWFLTMITELFSKGSFRHTSASALSKHCVKKHAKETSGFFKELLTQLKEAHRVENIRETLPFQAQMLLTLIAEEKAVVKLAEKTVSQWKHGGLLSTIPCMKAKTIVRLQAYLGPTLESVSPAKLNAYSGLAPVLKQSGTPRQKDLKKMSLVQRKRHGPLRTQRKACNHDLQSAMIFFTFASLLRHPWAKDAYERFKLRGQTHYEALRNVGIKWMKIIHAMVRDNKPYDLYYHQENIKKNLDPLNTR